MAIKTVVRHELKPPFQYDIIQTKMAARKRSFNDDDAHPDAVPLKRRHVLLRKICSKPTITDCFVFNNGLLTSFNERAVQRLWNHSLQDLLSGNESNSTILNVHQTLEFYKHVTEFPNLQLSVESRTFWLNQLCSDAVSLVRPSEGILVTAGADDVVILLFHILLLGHFQHWKVPGDDTDIRIKLTQLKGVIKDKVMLNKFYLLAQLHVGTRIVTEFFQTFKKLDEQDNIKELIQCILNWWPLFSMTYKRTLIQKILIPKLRTAVLTWRFPASISNAVLYLKPWQPIIGQGHLRSLQKLLLISTLRSLKSATSGWRASDVRIHILMRISFSYLGQHEVSMFIAKIIVPLIRHEISAIAEDIIKVNENACKMVQNLLKWKTMVHFDLISSILIKDFLPTVLMKLEEWLKTEPDVNNVDLWHHEFNKIIPAEFSSVICTKFYIDGIQVVVNKYTISKRSEMQLEKDISKHE